MVSLAALAPDPMALGVAVAVDLAIGDPVYRWHPVRLIGQALSWLEAQLRRVGADGYGGGILLCVGLAIISLLTASAVILLITPISPITAWGLHVFLLYSLLALGDLSPSRVANRASRAR